jgi:tetratricopeptide (TPR) repeat protein
LNKDNLLFATIGILLGFISGYLLHEVMAARQPPRRLAGEAVAMAGDAGAAAPPGASAGAQVGPEAAPPEAGGAGGANAAAGGGAAAPSMQEVQRLRDHVASHPNDADAVHRLADLNLQIRNWERARDLYLQYLKLRPADGEVLVGLGISYRGLNDYDQAIDRFRQAAKAAPDLWLAPFYEVVVLGLDLKRYDAAAPVLARLQKMQPANPDVVQLTAEFNRRRGAS